MELESFAIAKILILSSVAFALALAWGPALIRLLVRLKMGKSIRSAEKAPIMAKLHAKKAGTPTMGGVLVWGTALVLGLILLAVATVAPESFLGKLSFLSRAETLLPLGALVASALVGLVDDYLNVRRIGAHGGGLRARHRLAIYTAIAAVGAWWFTAKLDWDLLHVPFVGDFNLGLWFIPFFILVIVATSFSVNEADGLDGLAGGSLVTSFGAFAVIAFSQGRYDLAALCGVILGALMGFLWYNINPAKFFMGDTGSMALGVTLGIVAMLTNQPFLLLVIGALFVAESLSVIIQVSWRKLFKKKFFKSAPAHHHLEAEGWSEPQIVMRSWVISMIAAAVGVSLALLDALV